MITKNLGVRCAMKGETCCVFRKAKAFKRVQLSSGATADSREVNWELSVPNPAESSEAPTCWRYIN